MVERGAGSRVRSEARPGVAPRPVVAEQAAAGRPVVEVLAPVALARLMMARGGEGDGQVIGSPVPRAMTAYRGFADLASAFGVQDADAIAIGPHRIPGYLVMAHGRFLRLPAGRSGAGEGGSGTRSGGSGGDGDCGSGGGDGDDDDGGEGVGAVLECYLPQGLPAAWIAGAGDPCTLDGADMVLLESPAILITGHRRENGLTIVCAEAAIGERWVAGGSLAQRAA